MGSFTPMVLPGPFIDELTAAQHRWRFWLTCQIEAARIVRGLYSFDGDFDWVCEDHFLVSNHDVRTMGSTIVPARR